MAIPTQTPKITKVEGEHTVFEENYGFNDDHVEHSLIINESGLLLKSRLGYLGGTITIPLVPDRRWTWRYNNGTPTTVMPQSVASLPLHQLIKEFTKIADWLDKNPTKGFADYLMWLKLSTDNVTEE